MAKASCSYDLDPVDEAWLNILNGERTKAGSLAVTEEQFERVIEELEVSADMEVAENEEKSPTTFGGMVSNLCCSSYSAA